MKNKKIFLMLLLVFALFMFAGCNTNDNVTPDVPNTTNDGTGGGTDGTGGMNDTNNGTGLTTDSGINNNTNQ